MPVSKERQKLALEIPEGCSQTFQISLISDEKLRPHPDYKFLVEVKTKTRIVTTCRDSLEKAVKFAMDNM